MAIKRPRFRKHFKVRTARETAMYGGLRPYFKRRKVDTSATRVSKNSTAGAAMADGLEILGLGERMPKVDEAIQTTADGLKIYSLLRSPKVWLEKHSKKIKEEKTESMPLHAVLFSANGHR